MIKVAINGFGRIGRQAFKVWLEKHRNEMAVVAVNDICDAATLAHLLKYDSVYGTWNQPVSGKNFVDDVKNAHSGQQVGEIKVEDLIIPIFASREPAELPWKELKVDVVIESTGRFTKQEQAAVHISAGAKKVIVSAPSKDTPTFLLGVNQYDGKSVIVNNASCTTNCIAPVARVMQDRFGIKKAMMTTVHAVTAEQNLVDGPPPGGKAGDLRRARAAYTNIIPTTTGAAIATTQAIPKLKGKFDGVALRVPVICGSIADFTFLVSKKTTVEKVNQTLRQATGDKQYEGILAVSEEPLVSSDIIGRSESAIVDLSLTQVVDGDMVKVFAWYDNEWGYANRLIEQVIAVGRSISA
ncbi:MAG: type I glyceraldehyde-3-phosphate dehydrogenase [Patescibacteria group bacterium]